MRQCLIFGIDLSYREEMLDDCSTLKLEFMATLWDVLAERVQLCVEQ